MSKFPYYVPEGNLRLNVAILILVLEIHGETIRKKPLLNNERLLIIIYLVKNPLVMNKILWRFGLSIVSLEDQDFYSVAGLSVNLDPLFDLDSLKDLLRHVAALGIVVVKYKKDQGFLYFLNRDGHALVQCLSGDYLGKIRIYLEALLPIKSISTSALSSAISSILNE